MWIFVSSFAERALLTQGSLERHSSVQWEKAAHPRKNMDVIAPNTTSSWLAAKGLIQIGISGLEPLLHALMVRGDSVWLREGAHHVIRELVMGELRMYLDPVMKALEGVEPAVQVPVVAFNAHQSLTEAGVFNGSTEQEKEIKQKEGEENQ